MSNKLLLHICCGPCATATIKKLKDEGYEVVGYYYNPNIHPEDEYKKRLMEAKKLSGAENFQLIIEEYNPEEYFDVIRSFEEDKENRCQKCWELRLNKTASKAKELGIREYCSTLRISPYQNQEKLLILGKNIGKDKGVNFYEGELVGCFHDSVRLSKEQEMYRQKYCGCIFSKEYR